MRFPLQTGFEPVMTELNWFPVNPYNRSDATATEGRVITSTLSLRLTLWITFQYEENLFCYSISYNVF